MKRAFQLSLLLLLCAGNVSAQTKHLFPQTLGMFSYTYRNSFSKDVVATLSTIKNLGVTDMELSNLFNRTSKDIRKMFDDRGMVCS